MDLKTALQELLDAQEEYKNLNERAKEAKAEYDRLSIEVVPELLRETGLESASTGDKVIYLREDLRANVMSAQRGALAAELRNIGEGDLITEYVFPQTLSAWVRDRLEAGDAIPPQIELSRVTRAVPRKK